MILECFLMEFSLSSPPAEVLLFLLARQLSHMEETALTSSLFHGLLCDKNLVSRQQQITINRTVRASWLRLALRLRSEGLQKDDCIRQLEGELKRDISGVESIRKSLRYLRRIWLESTPNLTALQSEAISLHQSSPDIKNSNFLSLFMTLVTYPFVREIMEVCGRLNRIQGSIKSEQIKRNFAAAYGEREPVLRSTRYVVSLLEDLGFLEASETRGVYNVGNLECVGSSFAAFALEAFLTSLPASSGISRSELESHPALCSFDTHMLMDLALISENFSITKESYDRELVGLKKKANT